MPIATSEEEPEPMSQNERTRNAWKWYFASAICIATSIVWLVLSGTAAALSILATGLVLAVRGFAVSRSG
jgi:hypothetical protein